MKKVLRFLLVLLLSAFSFYYTEKVVYVVSLQDPIMKKIKEEKVKYEKSAKNATVSDNTIVPGVSGQSVDEINSFKKMKRYGSYNPSLYVFNEVKPEKSLNKNYLKYITSASKSKKSVSLLFTIDRSTDPSDILDILEKEDVVATFFIDGLWLENNASFAEKIINNGHEVEILSYNGSYDDIYFSNSLSVLNSLTKKKSKYCYTGYQNSSVLSLCSKLSLYTVVPSIEVNSDSYLVIKSSISNGSLISFTNSSNQLQLSIKYIKQRGFSIKTLNDILKE